MKIKLTLITSLTLLFSVNLAFSQRGLPRSGGSPLGPNLEAVSSGGGSSSVIISNLANNPNIATNILGSGGTTVTSNNLGTYTISSILSLGTNDLIHTNVTWVSKNGTNATAVPGNFARPYASISNAVQASPAGTLVIVEPGIYNESIRLKNGVDLHMPSVTVSQSVALYVMFDNGDTVTSRLSGDFLLKHTGTGAARGGIQILGEDSLLTIRDGTVDVDHGSGYGIWMSEGNLIAKNVTIYSSGHGLSVERNNSFGSSYFEGRIFTTNNACVITGGAASSNYVRAYLTAELYHPIQNNVNDAFILVEGSQIFAPGTNRRGIDNGSGSLEVRNSTIVAADKEALGWQSTGARFCILDDVQLFGGANTSYSIDNAGITPTAPLYIRTPIWANKPIRPDMNIASNGFTRVSRYLSITTNDYIWPPDHGPFDSFLKNNSAGELMFTNALQSLTIVSNFTSIQNTILSNVTVRGSLFVTNLFVGSGLLETNQYTTNKAGTPVIGSFWFNGIIGSEVTNGARVGMEWIPSNQVFRVGAVAGDDVQRDNYGGFSSNFWNYPTNSAPSSIVMGSNTSVRSSHSTIAGGEMNIIFTNSRHSFIGGGTDNIIDSNRTTSVIGGGGWNRIFGNTTIGQLDSATIAGGSNNIIQGAVSQGSFIGGGGDNRVRSDTAANGYGAIVGGFGNTIETTAAYSFVGGGLNHSMHGSQSVVVGGEQNLTRGNYTFIGGGRQNTIFTDGSDYSVVGGGQQNTIGTFSTGHSTHAFIGGGVNNDIDSAAHSAAIAGGNFNVIGGNSTNSFIGGGFENFVAANCNNGQIMGGYRNGIAGATFGAIVGNSNLVQNNHGTVVGTTISNFTAKSVEIGTTNEYKMRVDQFGAAMVRPLMTNRLSGTIYVDTRIFTNHSAAQNWTNLAFFLVQTNTLAANGDIIEAIWTGKEPAVQTNVFNLGYGTETNTFFTWVQQNTLTTGWEFGTRIARLTATTASAYSWFHISSGSATLVTTNWQYDLAPTHATTNVLRLQVRSSGPNALTNSMFQVKMFPAPIL